jgi:uncharacterized SAM-binding protein YcdF (DUF218 family)
MFLFKKVITAFILPPGCLAVMLTFAGIYFIVRSAKKAGVFNLCMGSLIWLISIGPTANLLMQKLEAGFDLPASPQGDLILLLGGGVSSRVPDFSGTGVPSDEMANRILTAVRLQKKLDLPILITGGRGHRQISSEAEIVKRFLVDLGVKESVILTEKKSRDTFENAKFAKDICQAQGIKKPILVTSAFHLKRSLIAFNKVGLKVVPYPSNFKTHVKSTYSWIDYLPSLGGFIRFYKALPEWVGILYYRLAF